MVPISLLASLTTVVFVVVEVVLSGGGGGVIVVLCVSPFGDRLAGVENGFMFEGVEENVEGTVS